MQISLLCLLKVNREENNMIKYKVRDVAKDLGVSVKEISDILEKNCGVTKRLWLLSRRANSILFLTP